MLCYFSILYAIYCVDVACQVIKNVTALKLFGACANTHLDFDFDLTSDTLCPV